MKLADLLAILSRHEREALAEKAGTTVANLYQVAGNHSKPSAELASRITEAAGVTLDDFDHHPGQ